MDNNGKMNGNGSLFVVSEDNQYVGSFVEDKRHGNFEVMTGNRVTKCNFKDDELVEILEYADGEDRCVFE